MVKDSKIRKAGSSSTCPRLDKLHFALYLPRGTYTLMLSTPLIPEFERRHQGRDGDKDRVDDDDGFSDEGTDRSQPC